MTPSWKVEPHTGIDKHFTIAGPLPLIVDNDDVDTTSVGLLAEEVARVLNEHWTPVMVRHCEDPNEECDAYWEAIPLAKAATHCAKCGGPMSEPHAAAAS